MRCLVVFVCLVGACGEPTGEPCNYGFDCRSDVCVRGKCQSGEVGAACEYDSHCEGDEGLFCLARTCRRPGAEGEPCEYSDPHCQADLECALSQCMPPDKAAAANEAHDARLLEEQARAERDKEAELLRQSGVAAGVESSGNVERAVRPPGSGATVRVAEATAEENAFAACREHERLIGGGCAGTSAFLVSSHPSDYSESDTVGARWNCASAATGPIKAYALCERLPGADGAAAESEGSGSQ